jgi:hypothetical protein
LRNELLRERELPVFQRDLALERHVLALADDCLVVDPDRIPAMLDVVKLPPVLVTHDDGVQQSLGYPFLAAVIGESTAALGKPSGIPAIDLK